jgi:hypothetical protein
MADEKYFAAQDTEQKEPLSREMAAQLQMGGTVVTTEDGTPVTLFAFDVLHGEEAARRAAGEKDPVDEGQKDLEEQLADSGEARDTYPIDPVEAGGEKHPDAEKKGDGEDEKTVHPKRSEGDDVRAKFQAATDKEDPEKHTVSKKVDEAEDEGLHKLTVSEVKEKIGDMSDAEVAQLLHDERVGVREAANKEVEKRGTLGGSKTSPSSEAQDEANKEAEKREPQGQSGLTDEQQELKDSQQEALNRPHDSEEARELTARASTGADEPESGEGGSHPSGGKVGETDDETDRDEAEDAEAEGND